MSAKPKYDPNALYYALRRIRRTARCIQGQPKTAEGTLYVEPATEFDGDGSPVNAVLFTLADRTAAQVAQLVDDLAVIAPVPLKK